MGTPLPSDYKRFIGIYGSGVIGEMPLWVFNPFSADLMHRFKAMGEGIFESYRTLAAGGYRLAYPLFPESGGLLPWGCTGNGDHLQWRTLGEPEQWTVAVWDCGEAEFRTFSQHNLTGFLHAVVALCLEIFPSEFVPPLRFVQISGGAGS